MKEKEKIATFLTLLVIIVLATSIGLFGFGMMIVLFLWSCGKVGSGITFIIFIAIVSIIAAAILTKIISAECESEE